MKLIIGGTGTLGSAISRRLLSQGEPVRVMTRTPAKAATLAVAGAEVVIGGLIDRISVEEACQGANTVIAAAHSFFGRARQSSARVDGQGHKDLIDIAKRSGVKYFIYTSSFADDTTYQRVPFFRIKLEVEKYLKASGLAYTILRPTAFMEAHAHQFIGDPIIKNKRVFLFGRGEQPRNFVAAEDVARVVMLIPGDKSLIGQTIIVGGPGNHSNMDVVRLYELLSEKKAKVTHLPAGLARALSLIIRPFHPGISQVMRAGALADKTDERFDATLLQQLVPIRLTSLEEWVANKLAGPTGTPSPAEADYSVS